MIDISNKGGLIALIYDVWAIISNVGRHVDRGRA